MYAKERIEYLKKLKEFADSNSEDLEGNLQKTFVLQVHSSGFAEKNLADISINGI